MKTVKSILVSIATAGILALLTWIGYNTRDVPAVKEKQITDKQEILKIVEDFRTDQAENNKVYNAMLYNLNEWKKRKQIEDSIKNHKN